MQQGGSQYGVPPPEVAVFSGAGTGTGTRAQVLGIPGSEHLQQQQQQQQQAEAASPISSRPPAPRGSSFDELAPAVPSGGGHADEDAMAAAGEEAERGAVPGNRWPRQETVALLKIRSDMDSTFRDATLKGPLWEEVSRKLAELGYRRSAKKCKEKFENVHKYYKRTKDGRAGRQDGKNYRFFPQLEALHGGSGSSTPTHTTVAAAITTTAPPLVVQPSSAGMMGSAARLQPTPLSTIPPPPPMTGTSAGVAAAAGPSVGITFSSGTSSSSASESEEEDTEEGLPGESRKRKRRSGGGSRRMMVFFEGLMRQVMERQEAMQQRFLETIEKREQDRMIREEAWKRQEVARLHREQEALAQERAVSASRDAAIIAFLQKVTGQTVPVPPATASPSPPPSAPQPPPRQHQPSPAQVTTTPAPPPQLPQPAQPAQPPPPQPQTKQQAHPQLSPLEVGPVTELAPEVVGTSGASTSDPASSRWPKVEVHALIKLRSGLESRYQDSGPKGPLWEDIAAGMLRMGYSRSAKRCKEKWENINKYYKKVKESNKKRTEDSKTCPYFHELDALYRKKSLGSQPREEQMQDAAAGHLPLPAETRNTTDGSSGNKGGHHDGNGGSTLQVQATNGGFSATFFGEQAGSGVPLKKPEDIVKELMDQQHQQGSMDAYKGLEEHDDSDNMDQEYDDDDDDDDEHSKLAYKIQYQQRPSDATNAGAAAAAAATGSFMAMVQ